jgi:hypothetical protein
MDTSRNKFGGYITASYLNCLIGKVGGGTIAPHGEAVGGAGVENAPIGGNYLGGDLPFHPFGIDGGLVGAELCLH